MGTISTLNLRVGYKKGQKHFLQVGPEYNVEAFEGELIALIGQNGSGKSTFLRTLARLQSLLKGKILVNDRSIREIPTNEFSTLLSYVSTETVRTLNITVNQLIALGRFPYTNWLGQLTKSDTLVIDEAIELTGLNNLRHKPVYELSDGERQRVMIARTLAQDTPIIILDEPTAYLDIVSRHNIVHLLADLAHNKNKTIIFSTHDLSLAISEADKIWLLNGEKLISGSPEDLIIDNAFSGMFGKNLEFDWNSGTLKRTRQTFRKVVIKGEKCIAFDLLSQALEKIGYAITDESKLNIEIINNSGKNFYKLTDQSGSSEYRSIYEVCRRLKG
jgi:iron complex transport system ATP-binding protein